VESHKNVVEFDLALGSGMLLRVFIKDYYYYVTWSFIKVAIASAKTKIFFWSENMLFYTVLYVILNFLTNFYHLITEISVIKVAQFYIGTYERQEYNRIL